MIFIATSDYQKKLVHYEKITWFTKRALLLKRNFSFDDKLFWLFVNIILFENEIFSIGWQWC